MIQVKICGLTRTVDVELATSLGADALGFVLEPSSPRFVSPQSLGYLIAAASGPLRVAVFGPAREDAPWEHFDAVQAISWPLPVPEGLRSLQVLRLKPGDDLENHLALVKEADVIVLDAFSEPVYGGTGTIVDWELAAEVVRISFRPVILAGGLTPNNVAETIGRVRPHGVDVSSGVEASPGVKDPAKLRDFIQAARAAFETIGTKKTREL
ncbi:MAG: phosphoribosylanthranilate isomerase [Fimbriimonas ginsengisoli]|nr:phosphoribosylanthranilate isomerase [Fimbriimonas ginsengisoli]